MTDEQRAHFDNLILMCPNHHVMIDDLEAERFTVEALLEMKAKALEANARRGTLESWATDAQLDCYVTLASVAMQRHYAGLEAPVSVDLTATAAAASGVGVAGPATATVTSPDVGDGLGSNPADRGEFGFARTTGFSNPSEEITESRYAIQVRNILGYDNVLAVDESAEPGRLDIATNWMPEDNKVDELGGFARANGLSIVVTSQGEQRRLP